MELRKVKELCTENCRNIAEKIKGHQTNENIYMNGLGLVLVRYQYPKQLMEPVQCASNAVCIKHNVHQTQCASNAVCIKAHKRPFLRFIQIGKPKKRNLNQ